LFFFSSRRRHTRFSRDWSSDVCSSDLIVEAKPKKTKVIKEETANKMTSMLLNVVESGTGSKAKINGHTIAGKTGSTQLPFKDITNGTKDQWFVGYTPNIVGAIWLGYDYTDREHYLPG